ncbi:MAG TPA: exodeoxyribonuclease III [Desulfatiglandales bacterium]|nr:exodeoxyribonuclease III [Desulfatiglandales bacterium]
MKIASFNTNGIRARLPIIKPWLETEAVDVLCIQETKVQDQDFPGETFEEIGYRCAFRGQKSFNGVAILSKTPPATVSFGFADGDAQEEPRIITAHINGIPIVNTYAPQGTAPDSERFQYKLDWFQRIHAYFSKNFQPDKPLLWVGDFNVAPEPIDVHDPEGLLGSIGYHPEEHKALSAVKSWGFVDVFRMHHPHEKAYTFWDYRIPHAFRRGLGWRVDHIWATKCLADKSKRAWIDVGPRKLEKPSDHTFILAEFETAEAD